MNLIFRIVLLFVLGSCSKNDPYPKYETTFSFEEREKNVIINDYSGINHGYQRTISYSW